MELIYFQDINERIKALMVGSLLGGIKYNIITKILSTTGLDLSQLGYKTPSTNLNKAMV